MLQREEDPVNERVVQILVVLGIVAAASCWREPIAVNIAADRIVGCRAPTAGCEECCAPASAGYVLRSSDLADWYNVSRFSDGVCPADKPTCAQCSERDEQQLRQLAAEPQCDCAGVEWGIDPCFSDGCNCFCSRIVPLLERCTGTSS